MKIKIAQIGLGMWGPNLLRNFNNIGVLAAAFDLDKNKIKRFVKDPSYKDVYFDTDWRKCLGRKDLHAVSIATPPNTHYEIAMEAMKNGKHVFIEKPMTLDVKEAEDIVAYAKKKKLIVMVGHIFLYSPEIKKLKEIVSSEDFGDVYYIYTERLNLGQIQSCGVLCDLMPHDVSILNYLLDSSCESVSVYGASNVFPGVEDVAFVNMKYGKVTAHLNLSWLSPLKVRNTIVVGSKQMAVCDSINKKIDIYNKGVDLNTIEDAISGDYGRHLLSYRYGDIVSPFIDTYEPLMSECKEFVSCIEEKRQPLSDGIMGVGVVKTLCAAKKSLENRGSWAYTSNQD